MCGLLFAVHPSEKAVPGNQVGSADHFAGQLPGADGTAQGVLADVDAAGVGTLHGLLDVHNAHIPNLKQPILAVEVDGTAFHKVGSKQAERDEKNSIMEKCGLLLLRLRTDGSGEEKKIRSALQAALNGMA